MRIGRILMLAAVGLAACGDDDPVSSQNPQTATVVAGNATNTFTPQSATIRPTGTITWQFGARTHNVTWSSAQPTGGNIPDTQNNNVTRTFPNSGTYAYVCTIHAGMNGTITVQ